MSESLDLDYDNNNNDEKGRDSVEIEEGSRRRNGRESNLEQKVACHVVNRVETIISSKMRDNGKRESRARQRSEKKTERKKTRRSPSYGSQGSRSRSRSHRSVSSSASRATYEDFDLPLDQSDCAFSCSVCKRGFHTARELAEHEIRAHESSLKCAHCNKESVSIQKLAAHMLFRHKYDSVTCSYCDKTFGNRADDVDRKCWEEFRVHVYKEVVRMRQTQLISAVPTGTACSNAAPLRGVGICPHGAAVKCKNFPNCPGPKCIYSHGQCRYDITCNKGTCPFDHSNRPRTCMACVNDLKFQSKRRY